MSFTINLAEAFAGLNQLAALDMAPWLAAVGKREQANIEERIREKKSTPDNRAWDPWKERTYINRVFKGNVAQGLLWDTGTLLNSIRFEAAPTEVTIGTDVPYAQELQEGRSSPTEMAPRPFIGWDEESLGTALGLNQGSLEGSAIAFIEGIMK